MTKTYYCPQDCGKTVYMIRKDNRNGDSKFYCPDCNSVFRKIQLLECNNSVGTTHIF